MRNTTAFMLGSVVTGLLIFVALTKYWDNRFEQWTSDFMLDNSKIEVSKDLMFSEIMYGQVRNIKNNDLKEFHRKACRFLQISLNSPMVSDAYKKSKHYQPIAKEALEYVNVQEKMGNCSDIPNK